MEVSPIEIQCSRKMCLASIRTKAERALNGGFCQGQPRGSMVVASEVNGVMSEGELAKRIEKRWITGHSLIQQLDPLEQIRFCLTTKARTQNKIFRAVIEIEGCEIGSRPALNGQFLSGRDFGVKLLSYFLRNLALDREHLIQIAVVFLCPHVRICPSVDQLNVHMQPGPGLTHASLQHVRYM